MIVINSYLIGFSEQLRYITEIFPILKNEIHTLGFNQSILSIIHKYYQAKGLKPELLYNRYLPYVFIFGTLGFLFIYIKFFKHSNTHSNLESQFFISSILLISTNLAAPLNLAYHMVYLNLVFLVLFKTAVKLRSVYISGLLGLACFYVIVHFSIFSLDSYYIGKTFVEILFTSNWVIGMLILLCLCYYFLLFKKVKII